MEKSDFSADFRRSRRRRIYVMSFLFFQKSLHFAEKNGPKKKNRIKPAMPTNAIHFMIWKRSSKNGFTSPPTDWSDISSRTVGRISGVVGMAWALPSDFVPLSHAKSHAKYDGLRRAVFEAIKNAITTQIRQKKNDTLSSLRRTGKIDESPIPA